MEYSGSNGDKDVACFKALEGNVTVSTKRRKDCNLITPLRTKLKSHTNIIILSISQSMGSDRIPNASLSGGN